MGSTLIGTLLSNIALRTISLRTIVEDVVVGCRIGALAIFGCGGIARVAAPPALHIVAEMMLVLQWRGHLNALLVNRYGSYDHANLKNL